MFFAILYFFSKFESVIETLQIEIDNLKVGNINLGG